MTCNFKCLKIIIIVIIVVVVVVVVEVEVLAAAYIYLGNDLLGYLSTDSLNVQFVGYNLKGSHRRHICNILLMDNNER
jgi:hypothetical protein